MLTKHLFNNLHNTLARYWIGPIITIFWFIDFLVYSRRNITIGLKNKLSIVRWLEQEIVWWYSLRKIITVTNRIARSPFNEGLMNCSVWEKQSSCVVWTLLDWKLKLWVAHEVEGLGPCWHVWTLLVCLLNYRTSNGNRKKVGIFLQKKGDNQTLW